jgi:hypothetical protein
VQLHQAPADFPVGITFPMQILRLRHLRCKEYYAPGHKICFYDKNLLEDQHIAGYARGVRARLYDAVIHYEGSSVMAGANDSPSAALLLSLALATMAGTTIPHPIAETNQHVNTFAISSS